LKVNQNESYSVSIETVKKLGSHIIDFKRMLRQYEFFVEDLNDLKELQSEVNSEFGSAIAGLKRPDLFDNKKIEKIAEDAKEKEESNEEPERDPLFKKLFRKVVVKCHPDRLPEGISDSKKLELKLQYENAIKANDDYNWALLISTAIKLEVELSEEYYDHVESLKEESSKVQKEIEVIQTSVAWTWYHAPDDQKEGILQSYVKYMEKSLMAEKKQKIKILGLGHPRTGTGFTSSILNSWGLEVGHEKLERDGVVAWQLAVENGPWPYMTDFPNVESEILIYNVRDPRTSIPSIAFTENTKSISLNYRLANGVLESSNRVEQAIHSILRWDRLITLRNPDFTFRIEDQSQDLFAFLQGKGFEIQWVESNQKVNARYHGRTIDKDLQTEFEKVRPSLRAKINDYCVRYGYEMLFA
jgi:hypothetical protein